MNRAPAGPRIPPLEPPYEAQLAEQLTRWMPPGSELEPLRLFRTLAVHAGMFARMRPLGAGILGHGLIDPREREIAIHRTCARAGAEYEWGVHVLAYGRPLGFSDAQITATAIGSADDPAWSEQDGQLVRLADELHESASVSDELWAQLTRRYDDDQLLELVIICGWYRMLSYVINAARVEREDWGARFPAVSV